MWVASAAAATCGTGRITAQMGGPGSTARAAAAAAAMTSAAREPAGHEPRSVHLTTQETAVGVRGLKQRRLPPYCRSVWAWNVLALRSAAELSLAMLRDYVRRSG